ncbi:hypothetical protein ESZ50_01635 [Weissella muntiaci]|uniref:Uncharacterized protein n=1 Tax=Weissella muntiaci TaxID=2508881 RepID=A0A6C2CBG5_9LACO|nr:hypothetical protein [Weissella muntiaci]TYC50663.1 hypothetical protein ESZ50_01635 [Weissella muntiaci]
MKKKELDQKVDAQFDYEQRRRKYRKNKPASKWTYIRPTLFAVLMVVTAFGLLSSIFALLKVLFFH